MKRLTGAALLLAAITLPVVVSGCGGNASSENSSDAGTMSALASANGSSDLSGTWTLNKDLSDNPPHRPDSGGHWRGRGGHPDSAARTEFRSRHPRREQPDSLMGAGPMHGRMGQARTMTIAQTDSTVEMTGPRGHTRTLYTDGRVMTPDNDRAAEGIEIRASWNGDGNLVIEHKGPKGGTRTETYSLAADGKQLYVAIHVDPFGDREARDFRRVYDAAVFGS